MFAVCNTAQPKAFANPQTFPLAFWLALCKPSNMEISPTELADRAGISVPYASQLLSGRRKTLSLEMAVKIYDATGLQFGLLAGMTPEEIEPLRRKVAA